MLFRALAVAALIAAAPTHAAVIGDFRLDGSLANQAGGPLTMTNNGGALGATGIRFGANQGPTISGFSAPTDFSIEFRFSFDTLGSYRKLIDFLDLGSDVGVYAYDRSLNFYPCCASAPVFTQGQLATVVLTRDSAGSVAGYVDGTQVLALTDFSQTAAVTKMHFFQDDSRTGSEASAGFVDYIRIYDTALTGAEVAALTPPDAVPGVPEPAAWAMMIAGFGLAGVAMRRRSRAAVLA